MIGFKTQLRILLVLVLMLSALCVFCIGAQAESGVYRDVDWDLTDGVLTIGKDGQTQTFSDVSDQNYDDWPWYEFRTDIVSASFVGDVVGQGNMSHMFNSCSNMTTIDISHLNTSEVTNMQGMFFGCSNLISLDVSGFDTSKVTNMTVMFNGCSGLTSLDLSTFDTSRVTEAQAIFYNCSNLEYIDMSNWDFSSATSSGIFGGAFSATSNLKRLVCKNWHNFPQTMSYGFGTSWSASGSPLEYIDVTDWDLTGVTNLNSFFLYTPTKEIRGLDTWDTSQIENMSCLFQNCSKLTSLDVTHFDTSNVTRLDYMFLGCSGLTSLDITNFDTSNVKNMYCLFNGCSGLTSLDLSNLDTSSVTDMNGSVFYGCSALEEVKLGSNFSFSGNGSADKALLPGSKWKNVSTEVVYSVYDLSDNYDGSTMSGTYVRMPPSTAVLYSNGDLVFYDNDSTIEADRGEVVGRYTDWDINSYGSDSNVPWYNDRSSIKQVIVKDIVSPVSTAYWFKGCTNITSVDLSKLDTNHVVNMSYMFYGCSNLTSLDLSNFNTSKVLNMRSVFDGCSGLTSLNLTGWNTSNVTNTSYMFYNCSKLTSLDVSGFDTSKVTNMGYMFRGCAGLTSLDVSNFDTSNVTSMGYMFYNCSKLTSLDLSNFDTSKVTGMGGMFYNCSALTSLDVSSFDTSNVNDMWCMFYNCSKTSFINVSNFDTSKVTTMYWMFGNCSGLESLDVSGFNTSNVLNTSYMFYNCNKLISLDVSGFDTSNVTDMSSMFSYCSGLTSLDLSNFNTLKVTNMSGMFSNCSKLIEVKLGQNFSFDGKGSISGKAVLPTGRWKNTSTGTIYTETELRDSYVGSTMYGTYVNVLPCARLYSNGDLVFYNNMGTVESDRGTVVKTYMGWDTATYSSRLSVPWYSDRNNIKQVIVKDTVSPVSTAYWFDECKNMTSANLEKLDTSNTTDMRYMFYNCSKLVSLDVSEFNMSNVMNMSHMFYYCSKLTSLDVSEFDTSSVTDMSYTFCGCSILTSLDVSGFDTSKVMNMSVMFASCYKLTFLDLSNFDTSKVTNISDMFSNCSKLTEVKLGQNFSFDGNGSISDKAVLPTGKWKNISTGIIYTETELRDSYVGSTMYGTYSRPCAKLYSNGDLVFYDNNATTEPDRGTVVNTYIGWDTAAYYQYIDVPWNNDRSSIKQVIVKDVVSPVSMAWWFYNCDGITSMDLEKLDTSNVTDMSHMFGNCSKLISLDLSNFDTSKVTNMRDMFYRCFDLTSLDVSNFNTSNVTNMSGMFRGCSSLISLDVSGFDTSNVTDMNYMFSSCSSVTLLDVSGWNTLNVTNMSYMFSYCSGLTSLDVSSFDTSKVTNMGYMFRDCSSLISLDVLNFNTSGVTNMAGMFYNCSALTSLDVSSFNTSKVTSMASMFEDCYKLASLDLSNFDTSKVTSIRYMFNACHRLTSLDLSNFDTSKVTDMSYVFYGCSDLISLDVSSFNTSNVTDMFWMFNDCYKLTSLDLSSFDTSNVTRMSGMFEYCSSLSSLDLSNFDTSNVTDMAYVFKGCSRLTSLDISNFNTSKVTSMWWMFDNCSKLETVKLGSQFSFKGNNIRNYDDMALLPTPTGAKYTGNWVKEDGTGNSYTPSMLRFAYNGRTMSGTWVWEEAIMTLIFEKPVVERDQYLGSMPNRTYDPRVDIILPTNAFVRFGYVFDHWVDGNGKEYKNKGTIPANRYRARDTITLTAVFRSLNGSVSAEDGQFEFDLQGGGIVSFDNIPGNTTYQVLEETPSGWQLVEEGNTSNSIVSDDTSIVAFKNDYDPTEVKHKIIVQKWIENSDGERYLPEADKYTFELRDENEDLLQLKTNDAMGVVNFDPIVYSSVGTYIYSVKEVAGNDPNIIYDNSIIPVVVNIIDDGAGHLTMTGERVTKYSHTANIDDTGKKVNDYDNNWGNSNIVGSDRETGNLSAHVVTIPGAERLTVDIYYNGESTNYDWACVWEGSHPSYTAYGNYSSSLSGKLGGSQFESYTVNGNSLVSIGHQTYTIDGDTVTFSFRSDGSGWGQGYGYYAVVTGNAPVYGDDIVFVNKVNAFGSLKLTKNAVDETNNVYWEDGETFSFNITFRDKYDSVPSGACSTYLSNEASNKGWTYDDATGVMTVVLNENKQSAVIENIPYGLRYSIQENLSDSGLYELTNVAGNTGVISETQSEAVFTNTFKIVPTSIMLMAYKTADFDIENDEFTFELLDSDMNVIQSVTNGSVVSDGMNGGKAPVLFDSIPVTSDGTFIYYIREVVGNDAGIEYDDQLIKCEVNVVNEHGYLRADVEYSAL